MARSDNRALRAALAGMLALAVAMGIGRFVYTPILPHMLSADALTPAAAGWLAGSNFLGYLVGALLASARFFETNRRAWFKAGLFLSAATTLVFAFTAPYEAQLIVRFASGVASAFALVFGTAIVLEILAIDGKPGYFAAHFGGVGLGIAASAGLVSFLVGGNLPWQYLWLASGLMAFAGLILVWFILPAEPRSAASATSVSTPNVPAEGFSPQLRLFITGYGFFGFGYVIIATFINTIAKTDPVLAPVEPWIWVIVGLSGIPSIWFWSRLANRHGVSRIYNIGCAVEAFGIALLFLKATPVTLVISGMLLGGTFMAITAIGLARARSMAKNSATRAIALMTAAFGLGQATGPVVAGYVFELAGTFQIALLLAVAALACTIAFTMLAERLRGSMAG